MEEIKVLSVYHKINFDCNNKHLKQRIPTMVRNRVKCNPRELKIVNPNAAGIDLGSKSHWVCAPPSTDNPGSICEFLTDTQSLGELADYLKEQNVTTVAMESTGVYWIPLFELLAERGFEVILADARTISKVPGRKTDVIDCQWIQQLHSYGLLKGAFRPGDDIIKLRTLVRMKRTFVREQADWLRRIQKELDQMNIRVHRAVSDITGKTGMSILEAIVAGERNPTELAKFRDKRCKKNESEIERELTGNWREEHLFNLEMALDTYKFLNNRIELLRGKISELLKKYAKRANRDNLPAPQPVNKSKAKVMKYRNQEPMRQELFGLCGSDLTRIDGISVETTEVVLSEIGFDMSKFPTERQFISYIRFSPSMAISGGKKIRSGKKTSFGSSRIREALRNAAQSLNSSKTALGAYYRNIAYRKGSSVAIFATARKIAQYIYRMLCYGSDYVDIGMKEYEQRNRTKRIRSLKNNAKSLGFDIFSIIEAEPKTS